MLPSNVIGLVNNAALLIGLGLVYDILTLRQAGKNTFLRHTTTGLILGSIGVAVMSTPWEFAPGVIFDTRSVLLCITGLFFGTIPTAVAVSITGGYRLFLGGTGVWTGVGVIATSGLVGLIWRYKRKNVLKMVSTKEMYLLGIVVHMLMLLWMLTLPWPVAKGVLSRISLPVMLIFPLGTALLGQLMQNRRKNELAKIELGKSEEKYRQVVENATEGIFVIQDDAYQFVNARGAEIFGTTREKILSGKIFEFVYPDDRPACAQRVNIRKQGDQTGEQLEHRIVDGLGNIKWVEVRGVSILWEGRHASMCFVVDITDRKRAETALKENEKLFRTMADNYPNSYISIIEDDFTVGFTSGQEFKNQNIDPDQFAGMSLEQIFADKTDIIKKNYQKTFRGEECSFELLFNGQNQYYRTVPLDNEDGTISRILVVVENITERRELESRLQQAQKMEAIGTLAGGIAHDFNNMLFPLLGYSEMLKEDLPAGSPLQTHVDRIIQATLRSKELVKQILAFSRQGDRDIKPIKLQPIVRESVKLLRSSIPTSIDIQLDVDPACGIIAADPTQIHQIIMNLATNAYHAMEENGGCLKVTLKQVQLGPGQTKLAGLIPGGYVCLEVIDTGKGINKEIIEKIFEPYYTTKDTGKGTGLGLSVVQGIVKSCNGDIQIESEPGTGTTVRVYLPLMDRRPVDEQADRVELVQGGTENILLIDDEEAIVRMQQQMLERLGYRVTTRTGSLDALEAFKARPDKYDLIVTDMTMPNMTGIQLTEKIRKIKADIPVILCTGYSNQINEEKSKTLGIQGYVTKPVIKREIARVVRNVLDNDKNEDQCRQYACFGQGAAG